MCPDKVTEHSGHHRASQGIGDEKGHVNFAARKRRLQKLGGYSFSLRCTKTIRNCRTGNEKHRFNRHLSINPPYLSIIPPAMSDKELILHNDNVNNNLNN